MRRNIQSEQSAERDLFKLFTADLQEANQRGSGVFECNLLTQKGPHC